MAFKIVTPSTIDDTVLDSSTIAEPDAGEGDEWLVGTTYGEGDTVIRGHVNYTSLIASNTGNDPELSANQGISWTKGTATNRWKVFDQYINDPATAEGSAEWVLTVPDLVTSVSFFGLTASTVRVVMVDTDEVERYDREINLLDETGVFDWESYWFSPVIRTAKVVLTDIPPYAGSTLTITATNDAGTVEVGQIVIGQHEVLGVTADEVDLPMEDFSRKERDFAGRYGITERDYADEMGLSFFVDTFRLRYVRRRLAERRAKPTVFATDTRYQENEYAIYGFFNAMSPLARFASKSEIRIEMEELV